MLHPRKDYARIQDPAGLIPPDEPVFILRAQDKVAARTVRAWAEYNIDVGGDPYLSNMARVHADLMDAWPVKKLADLPEEQPADQPAESQKETADLPAEQSAEQTADQPTEKQSESQNQSESGIA